MGRGKRVAERDGSMFIKKGGKKKIILRNYLSVIRCQTKVVTKGKSCLDAVAANKPATSGDRHFFL